MAFAALRLSPGPRTAKPEVARNGRIGLAILVGILDRILFWQELERI